MTWTPPKAARAGANGAHRTPAAAPEPAPRPAAEPLGPAAGSAEAPPIGVMARDPWVLAEICRELSAHGIATFTLDPQAGGYGPIVRCAVVALDGPDGQDGIDCVAALAEAGPAPTIVVVGRAGSAETILAAMRAGARDYIAAPLPPGALAQSVRRLLSRPADGRGRSSGMSSARFDLLTDRECEVLDLVVQGLSSKQIAAELGRVEKTVEYHRKRIMEKLGAASAVQLVRLAMLAGWTRPAAAGRENGMEADHA